MNNEITKHHSKRPPLCLTTSDNLLRQHPIAARTKSMDNSSHSLINFRFSYSELRCGVALTFASKVPQTQ